VGVAPGGGFFALARVEEWTMSRARRRGLEGEIMKIVTLLGVMVAFALGGVGCSKSSGTRAETTGGESAEAREAERKGKTERWELEEESEELREETEQLREESEELRDRAEQLRREAEEETEEFSKEKQREAEELEQEAEELEERLRDVHEDESRDVPDNEMRRHYNVLDEPNPTNP
jgi:chromosome segregation ATPase